jgi:hypothetical protein
MITFQHLLVLEISQSQAPDKDHARMDELDAESNRQIQQNAAPGICHIKIAVFAFHQTK